jgi:uncharacterized protein (DUF736 family)
MENKNMTETTTGKAPDYKGDGAAAWINTDKNGKKYLSVKILNNINVNLFKYEPKNDKSLD